MMETNSPQEITSMTKDMIEGVYQRYYDGEKIEQKFAEEIIDDKKQVDVDALINATRKRLLENTRRIESAQAARAITHKKRHELSLLRESLHRKQNELIVIAENVESENIDLNDENHHTALNLEKTMKINVLNDAFYI
mgnify:FL=1